MSTNVQKSKKVSHLSSSSRLFLFQLYDVLETLLDMDADHDGVEPYNVDLFFKLLWRVFVHCSKRNIVCHRFGPSFSCFSDRNRFLHQADWCLVRLPIEKLRAFEKWCDSRSSNSDDLLF